MRKRTIAMVLVAMTICSGCGQAAVEKPEKETVLETESDVEAEETDICYADMIPNPVEVFEKGSITIDDPDGGKAYILEVQNYKKKEFNLYKNGLKAMGFDDVVYDSDTESGMDFGAYSSDGKFWAQINMDKVKHVIYIICQQSRKERN